MCAQPPFAFGAFGAFVRAVAAEDAYEDEDEDEEDEYDEYDGGCAMGAVRFATLSVPSSMSYRRAFSMLRPRFSFSIWPS